MSSVGWQSPSQNNMPSPSQSNYVYPDPDPYGSGAIAQQQMYYPNSNTRQQSTGVEGYDVKPRMNEMWTAAQ
jgi:hypothetical protein